MGDKGGVKCIEEREAVRVSLNRLLMKAMQRQREGREVSIRFPLKETIE